MRLINKLKHHFNRVCFTIRADNGFIYSKVDVLITSKIRGILQLDNELVHMYFTESFTLCTKIKAVECRCDLDKYSK